MASTFSIPLPAGTHRLALGCYNNKKTAASETTECSFDDVSTSVSSGVGAEFAIVSDGDIDTASSFGASSFQLTNVSTGGEAIASGPVARTKSATRQIRQTGGFSKADLATTLGTATRPDPSIPCL